MKKMILLSCILLVVCYSCSNKDSVFPDYKYSTVYFPYQSPVKTLVLGEDIYDNTLDNQHKCLIMATMGGVYENKKNITLTVVADPSLAQDLKFESVAGEDVVMMPESYYSLPSTKDQTILIPSGKFMGGLEVQLKDAFFQDPRSIKNTFVIPMRITGVANADSVLSGKTNLPNPDRRNPGDWVTVPKDYVLFAVKYINPYHGTYLRRGIDNVKGAGGNTALDTTVAYHAPFVEKDELCNMVTTSLNDVSVSLNAKNRGNVNVPFQLILHFDNQGKCSIANPAAASYTITGTGELVKKGDMWGNEKRDVLYLQYQADFGTTTHAFKDTIVLRDRGVKMETFNPFIVN
ncbi:DUF5627 domain-containing protein [Pseudobacter ginsenosidimutans]|uniref:Uncharacterized protein DUF1735 n=1 Tax=Pseudobacter ginsenosidimutans TaxID=661488 RepID=A0A4Q7MCA6_9BACT|nr:DUF5627 domain-containing protein [Pseudobacter ginsenosidimutans]QEC45185.1 DUF1735 domain-containing protein [Pseudobacter ginsenosidimutans]RZS65451.1 uncharacterized protein DUF1735 [Pseudobacter ginsenosidimutans]